MMKIDISGLSDLNKSIDVKKTYQFLNTSNNDFINLIKNESNESILLVGFLDGISRALVVICNQIVLIKTFCDEFYEETNNWQNIKNPIKGYWDSIEIEMKIDINDNYDKVFTLFNQKSIKLDGFEMSNMFSYRGIEEFVKVYTNSKEMFYTVLEEKEDLDNKAIKCKTKMPQYAFARELSIREYVNEQDFCDFLMQNEEYLLKRYPKIMKEKHRFILIDNEGFVYGFSLSNSKILNDDIEKIEIEIEFWSKLMPLKSKMDYTLFDVKNKIDNMIRSICYILDDKKIPYVYPGERKYDWFNRLY